MEELARLFLLAVAVALAINLIKRGRKGVGGWFSAKFLGRETLPARGRA